MFRLAGIPLYIHPSWLVVLAFASVVFQQQFHGNWLAGFGTALLLFVSVLLHELGHSLVALRLGVKVCSITLFMLGGWPPLNGIPPRRLGRCWWRWPVRR